MQQKDSQAATLENAFNTFNALSEQLVESYQALELRVVRLTDELNQARSEKFKQLAEKEQLANRISQLLDLLPGGLVVLNGDGMITDCNPAAIRLLGYPLRSEYWHDVITRAFAPEMDEGTEVNLKNGKRVTIVSQSLGQEPGQIVLITDITEQYALQAMLNQHYRLSAMGEMAASLAHQIRTPLATALLYVSHLQLPTQTDEQRENTLDKVMSRLRHLDHIVNDMLQFARSGSYEMDCVSLAQIVDGLLLSAEHQICDKGGELSIAGRYKNIYVYGNPEALQGALLNIVTNAVEVSGMGVKIDIKIVNTRNGRVRITIRDNGPGIDKEALENIFTPFYTTRPEGTGLGLAVAHTIVEAHNGLIEVKSRAGQGASFTVELPKVDEKKLISSAVKTAVNISETAALNQKFESEHEKNAS